MVLILRVLVVRVCWPFILPQCHLAESAKLHCPSGIPDFLRLTTSELRNFAMVTAMAETGLNVFLFHVTDSSLNMLPEFLFAFAF